jgi:hypothetical protein
MLVSRIARKKKPRTPRLFFLTSNLAPEVGLEPTTP